VRKLLRLLISFVLMSYKNSVNPLLNPNPICNHSLMTIQYMTALYKNEILNLVPSYSGIGSLIQCITIAALSSILMTVYCLIVSGTGRNWGT
jgi:hypothetical protein